MKFKVRCLQFGIPWLSLEEHRWSSQFWDIPNDPMQWSTSNILVSIIFRSCTAWTPRTRWWSAQPRSPSSSSFTIRLFRCWWLHFETVSAVINWCNGCWYNSTLTERQLTFGHISVFSLPDRVHQDRCQVSKVAMLFFLSTWKVNEDWMGRPTTL